MNSRLKVGDKVAMTPYTDCFGVSHPVVNDLTVTSIQYIPQEINFPPYWRAAVIGVNGNIYEASQRFFN